MSFPQVNDSKDSVVGDSAAGSVGGATSGCTWVVLLVDNCVQNIDILVNCIQKSRSRLFVTIVEAMWQTHKNRAHPNFTVQPFLGDADIERLVGVLSFGRDDQRFFQTYKVIFENVKQEAIV